MALFCFLVMGYVMNVWGMSGRGSHFSRMRNLGIYLTFSIIIGDGIDVLFILEYQCTNHYSLISLGSCLLGRVSYGVILTFILWETAYNGNHLNSWILLRTCRLLSIPTGEQSSDWTPFSTKYKHDCRYYSQQNHPWA